MAKQVSEILVKLGIQGAEGLDKLKSSFRELERSIGPSDATIQKARKSILDFGEASGKSEQVIRGQLEAFRGLKSQAEINGATFIKLTEDIKKLEIELSGSTAAINRQRDAILRSTAASQGNADALRKQAEALGKLQQQTRPGSAAFIQLGKDIERVDEKLVKVRSEAQAFTLALNQIPAASVEKQVRQIETLRRTMNTLKITSDEYLETLQRINLVSAVQATTTGRQQARAANQMFESGLFERFIQSRAQALPLPETTAGLQQRISEVNQELANVTGYERRRALTIELIDLNRRLKNTVVEITTTEELAAMATRQRASAAREVLGRSGFGAFSADVRARGAEGSYDPGTQKAMQRARNRIVDQGAVSEIELLYNRWEQAYSDIEKLFGDHQVNKAEIAAKGAIAQDEILDRQHNQSLRAQQQRFEEELALFDQNLKQRDQLLQRRTAVKGMLGLEGRELSPLYQGIVDIGTRRAVGEQARMGKTPQQALADIVSVFNSDLDKAGNGFLESERQLREAAINFASGSEEVKRAFARIPLGQTPASMFPGGAEMPSEYISRIRGGVGTADLPDFESFRKGTTRELQLVRQSLQELRLDLNPLAAGFEATEKRIVRSIGNIDKELEKRQLGGRGRMRGMEVAQAAGAALSGGIFGGPEGFLGGALGGVFGGVGGAFAGAAAGAQVGMLRQQLGGFADYAAQIQKMQIALRDAAGSQDQFNQAVEAANFAVRNLNVPQDVAIQGMTKLTAAVKGAGGQVTDAELVFKNVTAAIKATGGSAQDVDGAITAMIQVFSKGKVSAEELSGQLGERLPGAVTKFAQANEMTLPELSKALEQGQVGLNELMNFIVQLGDEYSGTANQIADSSQDAGARLTVAFNDMRIAIGETLQPVGAQFQEAFADFIVNITPGLVAAAKAVGDGIKFIINNASQIGAVVEFAAKLAGVTLALKALQAMQGPIGALFVALQSGFTATTAQAAAAQTRIIAFGTAVKTVAASLVAPLVVTFAIVGAELVIQWLQKIKKARDELRNIQSQATGEQFLKEIGGDALTQKQLAKAASDIGKEYARASDNVIRLRKELDQLQSAAKISGGATLAATPGIERLKAQLAREEAAVRLVEGRYRAVVGRLPNAPTAAAGPAFTQFPDIAGDGTKGKADKEAEKAAREAQRLYEENLRNAMRLQDVGLRTLQLEELTTLERERQQLVNRDADRIEFAILDLKQKQLGLDIRQTHLNEVNERLEDLRVQGLRQGLDVSKTAEEISRNKIEYLELQLEAEKNITDQLELQRQIIEATGLTREMRQAGRRAAIGVFDYGQAGAANFAGGEQIYQPQEFMTPEAQRFQEMRQQLEEIVSLQNQVEAGAMQMGEAFSSAFIETITGSKSAKQALADLMASIGKHFLDMAQQIITQQIAMILYGTIMKALGVGLSGGGAAPNYSGVFSSGQAGFNPSVFTGPSLLPAANGAAFAKNGIQPFAMGGIVTKPTFFKYAKGGEMQNGLMGEAGPEAIMPLKRGADGKLGVAARLDGAMKRYRSTPGSAAAAAEGDSASLAAAGAATMEPIDVRYSVERINNVDYVTADQFQRGMAQAAQQGAIQGERRAMRSLKNSSATRRGIGL
jgi:tape measure domain-containing protein